MGTHSISDLFIQYTRETGLEKPLMEHRLVALWPEVMGETVSRLTGDISIENGVLRVQIHSAALKAQLFECRHELVKKLNERVGGNVIRDIRILG